MVFAFDGFHAWTLESGGTKTISVEEMVVITENGAEYLIAPQEELVLVEELGPLTSFFYIVGYSSLFLFI